jgi:hypothetical protein
MSTALPTGAAPLRPDRAVRAVARLGVLCAALAAPASTAGRVSRAVRDSGGRPVESALVVAAEENGTFVRRVNADADGIYRIGAVAPGRFSLTAQRPPYNMAVQRSVIVHTGASRVVDLVLRRCAVTIAGVRVVEEDGAIAVQKATGVGPMDGVEHALAGAARKEPKRVNRQGVNSFGNALSFPPHEHPRPPFASAARRPLARRARRRVR